MRASFKLQIRGCIFIIPNRSCHLCNRSIVRGVGNISHILKDNSSISQGLLFQKPAPMTKDSKCCACACTDCDTVMTTTPPYPNHPLIPHLLLRVNILLHLCGVVRYLEWLTQNTLCLAPLILFGEITLFRVSHLETGALAMFAVAAEAPSRTAQEQCRTVQARSLRVHCISVSNHILYHLLYLSVNKRSTWDWDWARVHASLRNRAHESARDTNRDRLTKSVPMRGDAIECRWLWVWETKQHDRSK